MVYWNRNSIKELYITHSLSAFCTMFAFVLRHFNRADSTKVYTQRTEDYMIKFVS